jgi:hypothetical protein
MSQPPTPIAFPRRFLSLPGTFYGRNYHDLFDPLRGQQFTVLFGREDIPAEKKAK